MIDNDNADYYLMRAEQEDALALLAANAIAAKIHQGLAERYRAKAYSFEKDLGLKSVRD